ncbi:MAG: molybdopterin synthase sulfur carrier subunit [Syntrophus sp. (in: bacteria)]|nr:molybdopterin synthase sulfur carrier subunit [Syntrophus sp. (in: bacteria)]
MKVIINIIGVEVKMKQETLVEPVSPALKDVLRTLKDQDEGQLERFIHEDLSPVDCSVILVNGRNILSLDGWKTLIHDGDELTFMVPVAGG